VRGLLLVMLLVIVAAALAAAGIRMGRSHAELLRQAAEERH